MKASGQTFYYHYNRHGDVIAMTDGNGSMVASYEYDAWGNVTKREEQGMAVDNPFGYAGYMYDEELNMYYLMARYYHPEHGVFLSMDPDPGDADDPITQNGYTYASNNPVMMVDPDGHWVWLVINAGFAAYDGYKAYKAGGNWKQVAWAAGSNFIGIGKVTKVAKVAKATKGSSKNYLLKSDLQFFSKAFKKPVSGKSAKEMANDVPSWAKGSRPYVDENGKTFAKRLLDNRYGPGNYPTGPKSEFNMIKKWGDRGFK